MFSTLPADQFPNTGEPFFAPDLHIETGSKRILLISGGSQGKLAQYRQLHDLGVHIVVLDAYDHWAKSCLETGLIEAFIEVNLAEHASLFDEIIEAVVDSGFLFDEVLTFSESAASLAARIAYTMGLSDSFGIALQ